jgi:phosphoglycolate phosphatase
MSAGAILFDFDGTLVDARDAAWELFRRTNERFGLGVDRREDFFGAFEGNFFDALERWCDDAAEAVAAKDHFFGLMRSEYHPHVIPGMVDVVRSLAPTYTLAVLSSNTVATIRRILEGAGIATCFSHVFAGDVEQSKSAVIRRFLTDSSFGSLRQCSASYDGNGSFGLVIDDVYLVTDTIGDIVEARSCGIHSIGVAWGMHEPRLLSDAGAERVALWPQELTAWFKGGAAAADDEAGECASCRVGQRCDVELPPARRDDAVAESRTRRGERRMAMRHVAANRPTRRVPAGGTCTSDLRAALGRTMRPHR